MPGVERGGRDWRRLSRARGARGRYGLAWGSPGVLLSFGFSKEHRLRKRPEYLRVQRGGRKFRSAFFLLMFRRSASSRALSPSPLRLGITVSKRVDKRATRRNFLKRRVREYFRLMRSDIRGGGDLVVVVHRSALDLDAEGFWRELSVSFRRASLLGVSPDEVLGRYFPR